MNDELPGFMMEYLQSLSTEELQAFRDKLKGGAQNGDKRQEELRAAYLKELNQARGSFQWQFNVRQRYLKLGYDPSTDPTTPENIWLKQQAEEQARRTAALNELDARKSGPTIKPEDNDLYGSYKAELSQIRKGDVEAVAQLQRRYRSRGLDI